MKLALITGLLLTLCATTVALPQQESFAEVEVEEQDQGQEPIVVVPEPVEADHSQVANQFIVRLKSGVSVASHHDNFLQDFLAENGNGSAQVRHTFDFDSDFTGYSLQLDSAEALEELRAHHEIEDIEPNHLCSIVSTTQRNAAWNLARISSRSEYEKDFVYDSRAGSNVDVYVLDTGVNIKHREFEGRAYFGANYASNEKSSNDDNNGHGTHVAGIIASKTWGVAKKARIFAVKVLDKSGRGPWDQVLAGLSWAYNRFKSAGHRAVINVSISGPKSSSLNYAVSKAVRAGMHVVVAAGNSGRDACNESPASATDALVVGSMGKSDRFSSFSNYGKCVDIVAPGESIVSTWRGSSTALAIASGTSMASPHAAGVKALFLAEDYYSPASLDYKLRSIATKSSISGVPRGSTSYLLYVPSVSTSSEDDPQPLVIQKM